MAQTTESDKALNAFESKNSSIESYILLTSDGIPFKYSANNISYSEAVNIAGLLHDLILYAKKVLDDLKKNNHGNLTFRIRLNSGTEIIIVQEHDFYLITMQVCRADSVPTNEKKTEEENKIE